MIVYTSPLKALAAEKVRDWTKLFPDKKILQLTGDILVSQPIRQKMMEEANTADILVMTCELLDSVSRNAHSENYQWLSKVKLLVADEAHSIAMESRGHAIEASIIRFCQIAPQAKVWFLSATLPNTEEFATWLTRINNKPTEIINSTWRPTELQWNFIQHQNFGTYYEIEDDKIRKAVELAVQHRDESTLVFVHAKTTGRRVEAALKDQGVEAEFYNADLDFELRQDLLARFESKNEDRLPVLISTSALAWGSVAESTQIMLWDGSEIPLKELEVGDYVESYDPNTGDLICNQVIAKELAPPKTAFQIELEDGTIIFAGNTHPFYVELNGQLELVRAEELKVGNDLATFKDSSFFN